MDTPEFITAFEVVRKRSKRKILSVIVLSVILITVCLYVYTQKLNTPTEQFPINTDVIIEEGMNMNEIVDSLEKSGVVRSSLYLYIILESKYKNNFIQAGVYTFSEKLTTQQIADAITHGTYLSPSRKVTLPEGFRVSEINKYLPEPYPENEIATALMDEGYLFPDTYFIRKRATFSEFVTLLKENYAKKITPFRQEIAESEFTEREIIILASIVEREANDPVSMGLVAGILVNRLHLDMPLQVDAVFAYHLGKTSSELTQDDLQIDSPYNTYRNRGLPPDPISNPGLIAIRAVLHPTETDYIYYLTDSEGNFYYSKTFEEHKVNKERYLR